MCTVRRSYWSRPWMMLMTFAISPQKCHVIVDINAPGKNYWLRRKPFSETHIFWLFFPFFHYSTQQSNPQISRKMGFDTHMQHEFPIFCHFGQRKKIPNRMLFRDSRNKLKKHSVTKNWPDLWLFELIVLVISKCFQILGLQPRISIVFHDH